MTMEKVTTYIENNRTFIICKTEGADKANGYWAFESKYIVDGHLTKEFNGITGNHSATLAETIKKVSDGIKVDALVESGMERMEAVLKVLGIN